VHKCGMHRIKKVACTRKGIRGKESRGRHSASKGSPGIGAGARTVKNVDRHKVALGVAMLAGLGRGHVRDLCKTAQRGHAERSRLEGRGARGGVRGGGGEERCARGGVRGVVREGLFEKVGAHLAGTSLDHDQSTLTDLTSLNGVRLGGTRVLRLEGLVMLIVITHVCLETEVGCGG